MALSVGEQVRWWSVGFVALVAFMWFMADALLPFLAGAAIAYFLDPVADRLEARGLSRSLSTAVITVCAIALAVAAIVIVVPAVLTQVRDLLQRLPDYAEALRVFVEQRYPDLLEPGSVVDQGLATLRSNVQDWSLTIVQGAWSSGLALIETVALVVVTPVVAFYLLLDWDRMVARVDGWMPRDHVDTIRRIASEIDDVLSGFVRGQLTVCGILGTFYAVALMAAGLQFGLVIGLFAGLVSFIPYVGSVLGGVLSIGVALFQFWDAPHMILIIAAIFLIGQAVEGNVITPLLVGESVGLHPVALMFALSAFGTLMGFTGLLIAVPAAAAIGVLFRFGIDQYMSGRLYKGHVGKREDEARAAAERVDRAGREAAE